MSAAPPFKILGYGHTGITIRSSKNENHDTWSTAEIQHEGVKYDPPPPNLSWVIRVHTE